MADPAAFAKLVPGFDFLQGLMQNAGAGLPAMNQWIAPTLDPQELDKRIGDLRTVQFWLEQNAKMIATTIQALEVQRMTLATLQTMNLPMAELRESMTLRPPAPAAAPAPTPEPAPEPAPAEAEPAAAAPAAGARAAPPVVDPMQWWGALTQQFSSLAAQALKDLPAMPQASAAAGKTAKAGDAAAAGAPPKPAARARKAAPRKAAPAPARRRGG